jgi:adenylate cyclase
MEKQIFVARERELVKLDGFLKQALADQGLVCFVTGEAGTGKTALVTEFARRAQENHKELVVAMGQSDAQTGVGDPYLPFREMLRQLTGDVNAKLAKGAISAENASRLRKLVSVSARFLVEIAPDLVGLFVPGAGLAMKAAKATADKAGWLGKLEKLAQRPKVGEGLGSTGLDQNVVFEQYTRFVTTLADKKPLLLILDDLQWADMASIGLLFRLGRRIEGHRILLVGTYRPEEVAIGRAGERHPLEKVLAEFKRYYGDIWVDLDLAEEAEGQHFVNAFLDTEPHQLEEGFRQKLFQHTSGHPLFTIELLRNMQERGDLVQDERGRWVETPALDWQSLPERVEGVIEERIGRLGQELRQILTVGSVEGEDFTAEVVARVQAVEAGGLIRRLSDELERQHRLIIARGVRRLEQVGQRLSLYRFQHNLFQKYLYNELDQAERAYLHEDVGNALEELYSDQVDEIVVQLARHFDEAGLVEKAAHYLRQAGQQAVLRFANEDALDYFSRALTFIPENNPQGRNDCLLEREKIYDLLGDRESQLRDLEELTALAENLPGELLKVPVLLRKGDYLVAIDNYSAAKDIAQQIIQIGESSQDPFSLASGYHLWGVALSKTDDNQEALRQLDQALKIWRELGNRRKEGLTLNSLGSIADNLGDYSQAKSYYGQALAIARECEDRLSEAKVLNNLGLIASHEGDFSLTNEYYEQSLVILKQIGFRKGEGVLLQNVGINYAQRGDITNARLYFEQALTISQQVGDRYSEARLLHNLGCAAGEQSDFRAARSYFDRALAMAREMGIPHSVAQALGNLGALLKDIGEFDQARSRFEEGLIIARQIESPHDEGWISYGLGEVLGAQAEYDPAMEYIRTALKICHEIGEPSNEASALRVMGDLYIYLGDFDSAKEHLEQSLTLYQEFKQPRSIGQVQSSLGLLCHHLGEDQVAQEHCQRALRIAQELGAREYEASAVIHLGHALAGLGQLAEAADAYRQGLALRRELGQPHLTMEPMAGLARVCLIQENPSQAQAFVEEILAFLESHTLEGTDEPMRVYLTCYQVLMDNQDPRARELLNTAYRLLQERAAKIGNEEMHHLYLENVPAHRELIQEFAKTG